MKNQPFYYLHRLNKESKIRVMKNTLLIVLAIFFTGLTVNAQKFTAAVEDQSAIDHESGVYEFYVNADEIIAERVEASAKYYTDYFSVKHKEEDGLRKIMVYLENPGDEMSIKIIMRLLVTMNIDKVNYVGSEMLIQPFFNEYMTIK